MPATIEMVPGQTFDPVSLTIDDSNDALATIDFTLDPGTGGVSVCDSSLATCPNPQDSYTDDMTDNSLNTQITAYTAGSRVLHANGTMVDFPNLGDITACDPQGTTTITVTDEPPWAQIKEGDAIVGTTDVGSSISIPVVAGSYLMNYDTGEYPGNPIAKGSVSATPGGISTPQNWRSQGSGYAGVLPTYQNFRDRLPSTFTPANLGTPADEVTLSGGTQYANTGYYYFSHTGDLTFFQALTEGPIDIGTRRVVVFVDGNVTIQTPIRVTPGQGFFMLIATGNIIVDPQVAGPQEVPTLVPDLEGVYYTDQSFETGSLGADLDNQLHVRGMVVAADQVTLQRNLGDDAIKPAEILEYAPDQAMLIPPALAKMNINWRETLP
jgi:hypothetical protein